MPQTMAQMITKAECIDKVWDQYSSMVLKFVCILSDVVTLKQPSNHEFTGTQDNKNFLAGMLFTMSAKGNLLQSKKVL